MPVLNTSLLNSNYYYTNCNVQLKIIFLPLNVQQIVTLLNIRKIITSPITIKITAY